MTTRRVGGWSDEQYAILREAWKTKNPAEIAELLMARRFVEASELPADKGWRCPHDGSRLVVEVGVGGVLSKAVELGLTGWMELQAFRAEVKKWKTWKKPSTNEVKKTRKKSPSLDGYADYAACMDAIVNAMHRSYEPCACDPPCVKVDFLDGDGGGGPIWRCDLEKLKARFPDEGFVEA